MAKISILVDTDIFIDYFNTGFFSNILENDEFRIYYSLVTKKELISKKGLKASEKIAIFHSLKNYRVANIDSTIAAKYSSLRKKYPNLNKEDILIASTALVKRLPLLTRNWKHYKNIEGLVLFVGNRK
ncbi:MAG: hypothetical protein A2042_09045 [Candidatus Schekmanbacteria bacterium GWA2_38_11]|uniref:PIN domain-containing protein n=1 Tax=Candidatus Schekmanbacteria bacterium GWA2_38_11 TaxID=1817876 RepID=A0A1F7R9Q5_9BACT|nr:MAG: hypothetical protein A2042_09045 [Candidatus Schekmanbacteria bacterium GWA2_38_11]HIH22134.1 type II toxin-antitoxin system VapC family toxin [Candidatus Micrarchaeota archaeon]